MNSLTSQHQAERNEARTHLRLSPILTMLLVSTDNRVCMLVLIFNMSGSLCVLLFP